MTEPVGFEISKGPRTLARRDDDAADRDALAPFLTDLARELNDQAPLKATLTRVVKMYRVSALTLDAFVDAMYTARTRTQEKSGSIRSADQDGFMPRKQKMAYFLAVLADVVSSKEDQRVASD